MHHYLPINRQSFIIKVALLTIFFSMIWLLLFYQHPQPEFKGDHMHDNYLEAGKTADYQQTTVQAEQVDNYIEQYAQELLQNQPNQEHDSAIQINYRERFNELCTVYSDLCDKTTRDADYSIEELFTYQLLLVYLVKKIDEKIIDYPTIRSTLSKVIHYEDPYARRGKAGHTHVKLNTQKILQGREYRNVLTHEFGHILDLGSIKGTAEEKTREYTEFGKVQRAVNDPSLDFYTISWSSEDVRKAEASYQDFVSSYAMHGIYEDFAETFNMYFNHHALLVSLAQQNNRIAAKYQFFANLMDGEYFMRNPNSLQIVEGDNRPWDTTKIGL